MLFPCGFSYKINRKYKIKFVHLKFYFQKMLNTGEFDFG